MNQTLLIKICEAIAKNINILPSSNGVGKKHKLIEDFQDKLCEDLKKSTKYSWTSENKKGWSKDSVDIYGEQTNGSKKCIIEIDASRADQVAKKFISRLALYGLNDTVDYVAILYPDSQNGKKECIKYMKFASDVLKTINRDSSVTMIYIDRDKHSIEIHEMSCLEHFNVDNESVTGMGATAAKAIEKYITSQSVQPSFHDLLKTFEHFISDKKGASRYKPLMPIKDNDKEITIFTYTQFRRYGINANWDDFVTKCRKNGIIINDECRYFTPHGNTKFTYSTTPITIGTY